jgi:hypothetical protein
LSIQTSKSTTTLPRLETFLMSIEVTIRLFEKARVQIASHQLLWPNCNNIVRFVTKGGLTYV